MGRKDARAGMVRRVGAAALLMTLAGCGVDGGQANLCQTVLHELTDADATIAVGKVQGAEDGRAVVIAFTETDATGRAKASTLTCRFAASRFHDGRLDLVAVETQEFGELSPLQLAFLRRSLGLPPPR